MAEQTIAVAASADDAAESNTGTVGITGTAGGATTTGSYLGFRFLAVAVDQGAIVDQAFVDLVINDSSKNDAEGSWRGQDADTTAAFTTTGNPNFNVSSRTATSATVSWTTNDLGTAGQVATSPDLKTIIQEIVDRPGWVSGNSIVLVYAHNSATDKFQVSMWDHASDAPPQLRVTASAVLTVADSSHGNTTENVALTQAHTLAVADTSDAHTSDAVVLTQAHTLAGVADSAQEHTTEAVTLTQAHVLTVADSSHAHTSENVTLTQAHTLAVGDSAHEHTSENVALTQAHTLAGVADSSHGHTTENVQLVEDLLLAIADSFHGHTSDAVVLTQVHILAIAETVHEHTTDSVVLDAPVPAPGVGRASVDSASGRVGARRARGMAVASLPTGRASGR